MHTPLVDDHWFHGTARADVPTAPGRLRVAIDPALPSARRVSLLELPEAGGIAALAPDVAASLGLADAQELRMDALLDALAGAGIALHDPDALWCLPLDEQSRLRHEPTAPSVRPLHADDAAAFAAFEEATPADDLDEAFVELDHWFALAAFDGDRIVGAASMYPWRETTLADIGVVTLPTHRGRGIARSMVRAIAAEALARGFEPQYRCQLGNAPSMALAHAAGFRRLGDWRVVRDDD